MYSNIHKNLKCKIVKAFIIFILIFLFVPNTFALDVNKPELTDKIQENSDISFEIGINDYSYASYISIETSIVKKGNSPIYDFGELNQRYDGEINRHNQNIIFKVPTDLSNFKIKISGKTPDGVESSKIGNVEITKFIDGDLKYYDLKLLGNDKKELGIKDKDIKTFKLIINEKVNFENSLKDIKWVELDELKSISKDMFDRGLVKDSKKIVSSIGKIKSPEDEGIIPYNEIWKNAVLVVFILFVYFIGYIMGQKQKNEVEE